MFRGSVTYWSVEASSGKKTRVKPPSSAYRIDAYEGDVIVVPHQMFAAYGKSFEAALGRGGESTPDGVIFHMSGSNIALQVEPFEVIIDVLARLVPLQRDGQFEVRRFNCHYHRRKRR